MQFPAADLVGLIEARIRTLSADEKAALRTSTREVSYEKGSGLLASGTICREVSFIVEGLVRYRTLKEDGSDITCYFAWEGGYATDTESYAAGTPSRLDIQAVTLVKVLVLDAAGEARIASAVRDWPDIQTRLAQAFYNELLDQRAFLLNQSATEKYAHLLKHYPGIALRAPQGQIASFLGITPQSLSRLRAGI